MSVAVPGTGFCETIGVSAIPAPKETLLAPPAVLLELLGVDKTPAPGAYVMPPIARFVMAMAYNCAVPTWRQGLEPEVEGM